MTVDISDRNDVLLLRLANGPANLLSVASGMVATLADAIAAAQSRPSCSAIVIAARGEMFCGGADLGDLAGAGALRNLFDAIELSQKPVIMAIHGMALGGGVELALAGHWRVAGVDARFAMPEVGFGLVPGLGGTQRLPRLVGVDPALDMMMTGETVMADAALKLGLIDRMVEGDVADAAVALWASGEIVRRPTRSLALPVDVRRAVEARRSGLAPSLNPAPARVLDCLAALSADFVSGVEREAALLEELIVSEASRGLRHAFFARRIVGRIPGMGRGERAVPPAMAYVGGRGSRARGTADRLRRAGVSVEVDADKADLLVLCDIDDPSAVPSVSTEERLVISYRRADAALQGRGADRLEFHCPGDGNLMEIVRPERAGPAALASMVALGRAMGTTVVVSGDREGSIFERLLRAYVAPVPLLLAAGLTASRIDAALRTWGMTAGPCEIAGRFGLQSARPTHLSGAGSGDQGPRDEDIIAYCLLALIDEGARLLAEGVAWRAADVDVAAILGLGFPRERGGPMFQANQIGLPAVLEKMRSRRWAVDIGRAPSSLIESLAASGGCFAVDGAMA